MTLAGPRRRALDAVCDTFVPGVEGLPCATEMRVPEAILEALDQPGSEADRRALRRLLAALAARRLDRLSPQRRERVLLSLCDSRVPALRAAFQALRRGTLLSYYTAPAPSGAGHPVRDLLGFPGPPGPTEDPAPKPIRPLTVNRDAALDCDVCVVGSGAGGGTAAAVLAEAGLHVLVLEAGGYYDDADFDGDERSGSRRLYLYGGASATADQGVGFLAGSCLGGGTTVNYTAALRPPAQVREEWARQGATAFVSEEYGLSLDAVCRRLGVSTHHSRPGARERVVKRGLDALGWDVRPMPRNVRGCAETCDSCGYGCRLGAKQSTAKTWLVDADLAGAGMLVETRAERVTIHSGAATGVEARTAGGHAVRIGARAVVVACGALETPPLLWRSGVAHPALGRHLRLHPILFVFGVFDEEICPWEGPMVSLYSDQHVDLDGAGYGVKYEGAFLRPSTLAALAPWRGARAHARLMADLRCTSGVAVFLRDRAEGELRASARRRPSVRYSLTRADERHLRTGLAGAARILAAAGARRIYSAHQGEPAGDMRRGGVERFLAAADGCGFRPGRCALASVHQLGTARMGAGRRDSACDPEGRVRGVRGLHVMDGSVFPTAPGVNPMISIEATAHMHARALAAELK